MRLLFSLLLLSATHASQAQQVFHGIVTDEARQPMPYAAVLLRSLPDSAVIRTEVADSAGRFDITDAKAQLLEVYVTGYKRQYISASAFDNAVKAIVLQPEGNQLKEVTTVASKPLLERKPDRTIFNVGSSVTAIGADGYEVLGKAPGVRANNGGISIVGKSEVSIMVNNRLVRLSGTELEAYLRSISASNIEKIEVITTPPARYDAQGNAGIINIVLKKSDKQGLNGNIELGYQQRAYGSQKFSENLNYRRGKLNLYSTGSSSNFVFLSTQNTTALYATQTQQQFFTQQNNPFYNRYDFGLDYEIGKNSVLGVQYTIGNTNRTTSQYYNAPVINTLTDAIDSTLRTDAQEKEMALRNVLNLNYLWKIDTTGKELNINADYFTRTEDDSREFTDERFAADGTQKNGKTYSRTLGGQRVDILAVMADAKWPTSFADLSFGAKASFIHTLSNNDFYTASGNEYVKDLSRSNRFDYRENTQALYLSAEKEMGKFEAQLGLRGEYTQMNGSTLTQQNAVQREYLQVFPTAYVQFNANDDNAINLNFSRRIDRPGFAEMNPFRSYGSGGSYESGNPFLQPSFSNNIELAYTLQSKYTLTLFSENLRNFYTRVSHTDTATGTFYFTADNVGNGTNNGLSLSAAFSPTPWWECNSEFAGYHIKIKSDYYKVAGVNNGTIGWSFETTNTFTCNKEKTLLLSCGFSYESRQQSDFDIQSPLYSIEAGAKVLFFKRSLVFAVNVYDILRTEKYHFVNQYNGVKQDNYFDSQCLRLSLNWKFGNRLLKTNRERAANTDEINRSK